MEEKEAKKRKKRYTDYDYWELAHIYVNEAPGNVTAAYRIYCQRHNKEAKNGHYKYNAWVLFQKPEVQKHVEELTRKNREEYAHIRDRNITSLSDIATDPDNANRDRIAAAKELNSMFGYNQANVNVSAEQSIEVVIE